MRLPLIITAALALSPLAGCKRKRVAVDRAPELPYPSCDGGDAGEGRLLASGHLRAGPLSVERNVVERFELRVRDCLRVMTVRQEWPLNTSDLEVVYDASLRPLRAWKRMALPGASTPPDIRRYELRAPEVYVTRRGPDGALTHERLRGGRPTVVLGPGRGLVTAWLQRARLPVGGRVRELALDARDLMESVRPVTLRREPDMVHPDYHRRVRVYTLYGRESVFADDDDVVIGDLAGMRPDALLRGFPAPPPVPSAGPLDTRSTP